MMCDPVVEISDGKLRGIVSKNFKGETVYEFLGIPYGKPPVGQLRFRAPQPVEPWTGIRDASKNGNKCLQKNLFTKQIQGSEDCLNLNVCTKDIGSSQVLKPVLLFIHGGIFVKGSGDTVQYQPKFLMCEDIVYVSINYRLGVLGFLSLSDTSLDVPGNAGLKDQVLALKWVQKNIEKFGGDPNNVTLFGNSAGSVSINLHVLSSSSMGLFHKAVMLSGSALSFWANISKNSLNIMQFLKNDCKTESEILEVLRNSSGHELIEAQSMLNKESADPRFHSFAPCVEKPNDTAFLTRSALEIMISGDYNKVPMIIGYSSNEGLLFTADVEEFMNLDIYHFLKDHILVDCDKNTIEMFSKKLSLMYELDKNRDNKFQMFGHAVFASTITSLARNFIKTCTEQIYFYVFDLVGSRNLLRKVYNLDGQYSGASHGDILGYIFDMPEMSGVSLLPGSIEEIALHRWVKFLTNFAKHGKPTPDLNDLNFEWKQMTTDIFNYLHFSEDMKIKTNPDEEKMALWRKIYQANRETQNVLPV